MEGGRIFKSLKFPLAHLPTLLLAIGYPCFWLELYIFNGRDGVTSPLAPILFGLSAVVILYDQRFQVFQVFQEWRQNFLNESFFVKVLILSGLILSGIILLCSAAASFYPPHLPQEADALNYHFTLPRQHLILGSFKHIEWFADDLFVLPLQFSLPVLQNALPTPGLRKTGNNNL